jgi:hypothetical protein
MRNHLLAVPLRTIALTALIMAGISSAAPAGNTPPPAPISQGAAQAPIGHRQPRPAELPRDVLHDERAGRTPAQNAFDKKLQNSICRKC